MASLDTNCLLRWLLNDIPEQAAHVAALLASENTVIVADAALIEAAFAMSNVYKIDTTTIINSIHTIMAQPSISMNRSLWITILEDRATHPKLSIVDLYLAHHARTTHEELPVYTFDRKLANQIEGATLLS